MEEREKPTQLPADRPGQDRPGQNRPGAHPDQELPGGGRERPGQGTEKPEPKK
jgi:hypothetical protein